MDETDHLFVSVIVTTARIDVLEHLIGVLCSKFGVSTFDGMVLKDYLQNEKIAQLERILIHLEDQNPTAAAFLSNIIDEARRETEEG
jgi:hypothetical protein